MSDLPRSRPAGTYQRFDLSSKFQPAKKAESAPEALFTSVLGVDAVSGRIVTLGDEERRSALYVLGKPGMGKTTLLVNLALQDIEHGHGVFFLDPHMDANLDIIRRLPLERKNDVILLNPEDETRSFCINLLACNNLASLKERMNTYTRAYNIFHTLWAREWGPWLEMIISNTLYAFIENPGYTLADVPLFLRDANFRDALVRNIRYNQEVASFWQEEFGSLLNARAQREQAQAALTRVRQLLTHPYVKHVIGYPRTTLDFPALLDRKKIVLVSLSANLAFDIKRFLGTILVSELLKASRDRVKLPKSKRHQFSVFVDEFQNFATPDFATFITESRKFSIATTIAHQERAGQLDVDRKILGATLATAHKIIYQPTVEDAETVAKEFATRPDPASVEILDKEWVEELDKEWVEELDKEWVEEIEPESIEILKDEYEDRTVDEWEDGIEPVMTVSQSPLELLAKGHASPRISTLISQFLSPLELAQEAAQLDTKAPYGITTLDKNDKKNYYVTREQLLNGKELINRLLVDLMQERLSYDSQECIDRMVGVADTLRGFIPFTTGDIMDHTKMDDIRIRVDDYWYTRNRHERGYPGNEFTEEIQNSLAVLTAAVVEGALSKHSDRYDQTSERGLWKAMEEFQGAIKFLYAPDSRDRSAGIAASFQRAYEETSKGMLLLPPEYLDAKNKPGWFTEYNEHFMEATERAGKETEALVKFLAKLYALCIELSQPENRIMVQSGQYQPRKHQQPHYTQHSRLALNHPRKELMHPRRDLNHPRRELNHPRLDLSHPQRSIADMVAEKELDLLDLANYTGYYKLSSKEGIEKGKLIARKLPKENLRIMSKNLAKHILANTYRDYCVTRAEIDEAIRERQAKALNNQITPAKNQRGSKEPDDDAPRRRG